MHNQTMTNVAGLSPASQSPPPQDVPLSQELLSRSIVCISSGQPGLASSTGNRVTQLGVPIPMLAKNRIKLDPDFVTDAQRPEFTHHAR